jgi:hypothetical protein
MMLFTHMPFWVYWLVIGLAVSGFMILHYNTWPTWLKVIMFPTMILAWPIGLPGWIGYALIRR